MSGGQTGVDRGALDAALALGIDHGGWCPRGRRAEDGVIPAHYQLQECDARSYHVRTELNVQASDGTLILFRGELSGGTALTHQFATKHHKPCLLVDLSREPSVAAVYDWLATHRIAALNVAGPRASSAPNIRSEAHDFLTRLFSAAAPPRAKPRARR